LGILGQDDPERSRVDVACMKRFLFSILVLLVLLSACNQNYSTPTATDDRELFATPTATEVPVSPTNTPSPVPLLQRGVNLGNMLEAPNEGEWGLYVQKKYFDLIKQAGFDFVRLPVRWNGHAQEAAPYTVDPAFFTHIDDIVSWALKSDLVIILDFHNYDELISNPSGNKDRFIGIWRQIAQHYKNAPANVLFELLNEPNTALNAALWNQYVVDTLNVVRESNPTRDVVVGPTQWNSYAQISTLEIPDDPHIIVTFHYYEPFQFTHQGAEWVDGSTAWLGKTWEASDSEKAEIKNNFNAVAQWSQQHRNVRILLGEFGAYSKAPQDSRVRWTEFVRGEAERHGFAWAYWEFGAGFGVYDPNAKVWRQDLLKALIP
jgi:endoglucanase